MQKRCLSDLTIKNDFMFGAVMINPENCKEFLERALEIEIDRVDVSREKSMVYHPDYKGIRLDVYAKDENNTCYNVEMQMTKKPALGRRSRYYQSQMDMDLLLSGREYAELPDSYVIFILLVKENIVILFRCSAKKAIEHHWKTEEKLYF